ncbi:MAG: hypothetical protein ACQ9MH_17325 [Nitrospinales bacterium]
MIDLGKTFYMICKIESDINEHLPVLYTYGKLVDHITEFGVRRGRSTVAWQYAAPKTLISYDIDYCDVNDRLMADFDDSNRPDFRFIQADVLEIDIEETDLIFFDTYHTYKQLSGELKRHGNKARKYLIFHDIVTYGIVGEDKSFPGIAAAIDEFVVENRQWSTDAVYKNNNGLLVLKRD